MVILSGESFARGIWLKRQTCARRLFAAARIPHQTRRVTPSRAVSKSELGGQRCECDVNKCNIDAHVRPRAVIEGCDWLGERSGGETRSRRTRMRRERRKL